MIRFIILISFLLLSLSLSSEARPKTTLVFWHSLAGSLSQELEKMVTGFNESQEDYVIQPVYKGEYTDTLTSFTAAYRAKMPPDIVQVYEVGTAAMLSPSGIIKPLDDILQEAGIRFDQGQFLPAIWASFSKAGKLQAMPFNTSVPLIFYNADLLSKVGIHNRAEFPKTWQELEVLFAKLKKAGFSCAYTSAYPAWIHIESFAALHGIDLFDKNQERANYQNSALLAHLERLKKWQKAHYFEYGGRGNDATSLFTSGRCALFSQSSGGYKGLLAIVPFHIDAAPLPVDASLHLSRHNNVIGGAALWAVSGLTPIQYRGIARFYRYITLAPVQERWYQNTGYIPFLLSEPQSNKDPNEGDMPTLQIARFDLGREAEKPSLLSKIPLNQIRSINDEALEAIFSNIKSPEDAMNHAETRANFALKRFASNNRILVN